jgi:hypothetical protein
MLVFLKTAESLALGYPPKIGGTVEAGSTDEKWITLVEYKLHVDLVLQRCSEDLADHLANAWIRSQKSS